VIARRFVVTGVVQGVGYRIFALRAAEARGVRGWVRNLPDGGVEVLAEGEEAEIARLREALRTGPRHARVDALLESEEAPTGRFRGFDVIMS